MANTLFVINKVFLSALGQPLPGISIAILVGDINGAAPVDSATQPGSPLATIYADPQAVTALTNPTTPGTNTVGVDGLGNLCSIVNGVTSIGVWVDDSSSSYFVLQAYGPGVTVQQLTPLSFPSGGGGGA